MRAGAWFWGAAARTLRLPAPGPKSRSGVELRSAEKPLSQLVSPFLEEPPGRPRAPTASVRPLPPPSVCPSLRGSAPTTPKMGTCM